MKRNMEIVRDMLLTAEDGDRARIEKYSKEDQAEHFLIMKDAGLVLGIVSGDDRNPGAYRLFRMTWAGHEFLDAMRDDTVWKKAKDYVLKPGASWTFEVLKEWLKYEVLTRLGVPSK